MKSGNSRFNYSNYGQKYIHTKHKPNNTMLINEKLEPIMIEIGNMEIRKKGMSILVLFIFLFEQFAYYSF